MAIKIQVVVFWVLTSCSDMVSDMNLKYG